MNRKWRVLVLDDDDEVGKLLVKYLLPYGMCVQLAVSDEDLRFALTRDDVDVVLMDVVLRTVDGFNLTRELRQQSQVPIIVISARSDHYDRILGLESGADDYVTKPFEPRELVARIQAVLRRSKAADFVSVDRKASRAYFDGWTFDSEGHTLLSPEGRDIALSSAEFRLLAAFVQSPRKLLSRDELRMAVSGHAYGQGERSIDLLISRLRQKLSQGDHRFNIIKTVRGRGYRFDTTPSERRKE